MISKGHPRILLALFNREEMEAVRAALEKKFHWAVETTENLTELEHAVQDGERPFDLIAARQEAVPPAAAVQLHQRAAESMPSGALVLVSGSGASSLSTDAPAFDDSRRLLLYRLLKTFRDVYHSNGAALRGLRTDFLAGLIRIGQALTRTKNLDRQMALISDFARGQMGVDTFFIALYDPDHQMLHFQVCYDEGKRKAPADRFIGGSDPSSWGVAGYVARMKEELFWMNADEGAELCRQMGLKPINDGKHCESCIYVPLVTEDMTLGVMSVQSYSSYALTEEMMDMFRALASQVSVSIENARLYKQAEQVGQEAHDVAISTSTADFSETLNTIVRSAQHVLHCDVATLFIYDQDTDDFLYPPAAVGAVDLQAITGRKKVTEGSAVRRILNYGGMHESIDSQHDPMMLRGDNEQDERPPFVVREQIQSSIGIPLKVRGKKVGVLFINFKEKKQLTSQERMSAEMFANQAAIAIHNIQMSTRLMHQDHVVDAIQDINKALTTQLSLYQVSSAVLDTFSADKRFLETILMRIAEQACHLTGYSGEPAALTHISLVEGNMLNCKVVYPPEREQDINPEYDDINLDNPDCLGVTGRVVKTGKSILLNDIRADSDYLPGIADTRSELTVPILTGNVVCGVINVEHNQYSAFSPDDLDALELLAAQAAGAIQNAQLFDQIRESREYIEALYTASSAVLFSEQPERLYLSIVQNVKQVSEAWRVILYRIDMQAGTQEVLAEEGFADLEEITQKIRENGISKRVMASQLPFFCEDVRPGNPDVHPRTIQSGARAVACLPLLTSSGRSIGVMWLHFNQLHTFSEFERSALRIYANHSAMVIENARRYKELNDTRNKLAGSTALAWSGMIYNTWFHAVEKHALIIEEQADLLRKSFDYGFIDVDHMRSRLDKIQETARTIRAKPMTPPLSSEEGVINVEINNFVRSRVWQLIESNRYQPVRFVQDYTLDNQLCARFSPEWMRRALDLLIENAVQATAGKSNRQVNIITRMSGSEADAVEIVIQDNGPGVPDEIRSTLFEGPVLKKPGEKGLGIGLLMVTMILQTYGGTIRFEDVHPVGTAMIISIPLAISLKR